MRQSPPQDTPTPPRPGCRSGRARPRRRSLRAAATILLIAGTATAHADEAQIASRTKLAAAAIEGRDYTTAVKHYRFLANQPEAAATGAAADLRKRLIASGIDAELLAMPGGGVTASARDRVVSNLATARAALDRGDLKAAYAATRQAEAVGAVEADFRSGDTRPWQVMLDVQSAARRAGVTLDGSTAAAGGVAQTGGVDFGPGGTVAFGPGGTVDFGQVMQAGGIETAGGIAQVGVVNPLPPADDAQSMFDEGMKELAIGRQDAARAKFIEAWKRESDLDATTRRLLRDKLTLLQPSRLPSPTGRPAADLTPIEKADIEANQRVRRLYREVTAELATAGAKRTTAPLDAVDDLQALARRVEASNIPDVAKTSLSATVAKALRDQQTYVEANKAKIELALANESVRTEMQIENERTARIDSEISTLVETFNELMDERRYAEAEVVAKQVGELKPNSAIATSMLNTSRMETRLLMNEQLANAKEEGFFTSMYRTEQASIPNDPDVPLTFPDRTTWESVKRRSGGNDLDSQLSEREKFIKRQLAEREVQVRYRDRPLGEVLDDLSNITGVPIVLDNRAIAAIRVTRDTPLTQTISTPISLRSALNILLQDLDLTYMLENDVLTVTTNEMKRTRVRPFTYRVADLVTPIPNFVSGYDDGLRGAQRMAYQMINSQSQVNIQPVSLTGLGGFAGGGQTAAGTAIAGGPGAMGPGSNPNVLGQYNPGGLAPTSALGGAGGRGGGSFADFTSLIQLIQTTIEPTTWEALGGVSTMQEYPQNLSLVISTTSDVHDQIVDLLESLRRLQNLQITIEVRFITLGDTFFEQIGVDFDVQFDDNAPGLPQDDAGPDVTIGVTNQGSQFLPTADLDIAFENNSFGITPAFGGFDVNAASSIGFAILSDIEAFFFLQAVQGNNRTNIMQSPKVTLFDGQLATISDITQRPFVTSIIPVVGDFAVAQQPVVTILDEGTRLNVQGVVSDDKRFVRLTLVPTFSQIGAINTFTFEGSRTTNNSSVDQEDSNGDGVIDENDEIDTVNNNDVIQGTTVQQPTFASTSVSTTVSVPDGGTILLGGIKRLSEGPDRAGRPVPIQDSLRQPVVPQRGGGPRHPEPDAHGDPADHHPGGGRDRSNRVLAGALGRRR